MAYTKEQAWELLTQYNKGEFHLKHANTVADVMRWYAEKLGYGDEADFWEIVGLLHDLDFEMYPDEHCIKSQEIMRENGLDERLIRATASHGYRPAPLTAFPSSARDGKDPLCHRRAHRPDRRGRAHAPE